MALSGAQDFWRAGAHVYFQRAAVSGTEQKFFDLGVVQSATPSIENTEVELFDPRSGVLQRVANEVSQIDETYEIECNNFNLDNISILFSASAPETFSQAATQVTDAVHAQPTPGALIKIRTKPVTATDIATKDNSSPIYLLTSIDTVKSADGMTTYTVDDDYEVVSLARGIIRTIVGGSGGIESETELQITYTPTAVSSSKRLIKPQTASAVLGEFWCFYTRDGVGANTRQTVRYAPNASMIPTGADIQVEEFSSMTFEASILSDILETEPAGTLLQFIGDLPSIS